jgi:hypothetical protein
MNCPPVSPSRTATYTHARLVMAPDESGPVPLDIWISPPLVIHAQLDVESDEPYTILHLTMRLPVTMTVRIPDIVNTVDPTGQVIVRSPVTARILRLPLTAYCSRSATVETLPPVLPTRVGRVLIVATHVVLEFVVDVFNTTVVPRKSAKTS